MNDEWSPQHSLKIDVEFQISAQLWGQILQEIQKYTSVLP